MDWKKLDDEWMEMLTGDTKESGVKEESTLTDHRQSTPEGGNMENKEFNRCKLISLYDVGEKQALCFIEDKTHYRDVCVEKNGGITIMRGFPKTEYRSYEHFADVLGKFRPEVFFIRNPIRIRDVFNYDFLLGFETAQRAARRPRRQLTREELAKLDVGGLAYSPEKMLRVRKPGNC